LFYHFISERPEIEGGEGEIENLWVLEGDNIDLTCEAGAVPPPVITWRRGEDYSQVSVNQSSFFFLFVILLFLPEEILCRSAIAYKFSNSKFSG